MNFSLNETQQEQISIEELAQYIFRVIRENDSESERVTFNLSNLEVQLCPKNRPGYKEDNEAFHWKFCEAINLLKQQGLLMDVKAGAISNVGLTCVGNKSNFDEGILMLVDDAYEVVQSLKEKTHNFDPVVEQYYLESLRTCQNGSYISSVICLGAASERIINCLAEAVVECMPECKKDIDSKHRISALTRHLLDNAADLFASLDLTLRNELKEKLTGLANIYRLNRNEAGHPSNVPQDWERDEQKCYLSQFRRLAVTCFKAIDELKGASAGSVPE